jgi:hypothetical protein
MNRPMSGNSQPKFQYRFSPSYRLPVGDYAPGVATLRFYGTYAHVGAR